MATHDISEGGIAAALAEMGFGGNCGVEVNLKKIATLRPDLVFFNETPGTFLVEVEDAIAAKKLFSGVPYFVIGKTTSGSSIKVSFGSRQVSNLQTEKLKKAWQKPMEELFH